MIFTQLPLNGIWLIEGEKFIDGRGFFARLFCSEEFAAHGLESHFIQMSISFNTQRSILRGLHYQSEPHGETKLVRVTAGAIWDVVVDLRRDSQTLYNWYGLELSAANRRALYIPKGFAHGFLTLADDTEVLYQMADPYMPAAASGLRWNDPRLAIVWPLKGSSPILSDRDDSWPTLTC